MNTKLFSFYKGPIQNTKPLGEVALKTCYEYITSDTAQLSTETLRAIDPNDKKSRRKFKEENFDSVTFSGTFTKRDAEHLIAHSGLIGLDFDHMPDCVALKEQLLKDPYFQPQLLFTSVSGTGLRNVIQIDLTKADHATWFKALSHYVKETYGIAIDPQCSDVCRASFLPYDPEAYLFREEDSRELLPFDVETWAKFGEAASAAPRDKVKESSFPQPLNDLEANVEQLVRQVEAVRLDLTANHGDWVKVGFALAHELGERGRAFFHRLCRFYPDYQVAECDKQYDACLRGKGNGVTISSLFYMAKEAGILLHTTSKAQKADNWNSGKGENGENEGSVDPMEQDELPIFSRESIEQLPSLLRTIPSYASTPAQGDILLLGSLCVLSAVIENVYAIYNKKQVFSNLFTYIVAEAGSGKGIASACLKLIEPILVDQRQAYLNARMQYQMDLLAYNASNKEDKGLPPVEPPYAYLIIPGNSSTTAAYQALNDNQGVGLTFETEGDTMGNSFKSDYGDYSEGLCKAFHHENISYIRRKDKERVEIIQPRWSIGLTSTPGQVIRVFVHPESGLPTRFVFYFMSGSDDFADVFAEDEVSIDDIFAELGQRFKPLYDRLKALIDPIRFVMDATQKAQFIPTFDAMLKEYKQLIGQHFHGALVRLALSAFRIAMILSVVRLLDEPERLEEAIETGLLTCKQVDFEIALSLTSTLLEHSAMIFATQFSELDKDESQKGLTPEERALWSQLSETFTRQQAIAAGAKLQLNEKRVDKIVGRFQSKYKIARRIRQGQYQKAKRHQDGSKQS